MDKILFSLLAIIICLAFSEAIPAKFGSIENTNIRTLEKRSPNIQQPILDIFSELPTIEAKMQRIRRFILPSRFNNKRNEDFYEDPRFFSSAFGKRSNNNNLDDDFNDPRFFSSAFGKRNKPSSSGSFENDESMDV